MRNADMNSVEPETPVCGGVFRPERKHFRKAVVAKAEQTVDRADEPDARRQRAQHAPRRTTLQSFGF